MSDTASPYHIPVLLHEAVDFLINDREGTYLDGTLGGGGHSEAILQRLGPRGTLVGLDLDHDALAFASRRLAHFGARAHLLNGNFRDLRSVLEREGIDRVHGVLLDLGVSSFQLDEPAKGFSFRSSDRLDMRMNDREGMTAETVVNDYDEQDLAGIFWKYGEEQDGRRIARTIVRQRALARITTTGALAAAVEQSVNPKYVTKSLARVFQAIRIEVNGELDNLQQALVDAVDLLVPGGRLVVIAYHSLEDRIVKETFRAAAATSIPSGHKLLPDTPLTPVLKLLTKKPVEASEEELERNPRARSAKLRAAERI